MRFYLKQIALTNFKNYKSLKLKLNPKFNAFVGKNGMGKTNLLDAIYYLCIVKSYFTGTDRNIVKFEEDFFRLEGDFQELGTDRVHNVVAKVNPGKSKTIELNAKKYKRQSEHIGKFPIVIIAPSDIYSLLEASEERRRFLDRTLMQFDKEYLQALLTYNRLLLQRNTLLKKFSESGRWDDLLLASIEEKMNAPASLIFKKRSELVTALTPIFLESYEQLSGAAEVCQIQYKSDLAEHSMSELFSKNRDKDRILKRTSAGIHKDDITLFLNDKSLKTFASQGQLKSFIFSLKIAQYKYIKESTEAFPILILDDIFDKLDVFRVSALIKLISSEEFGQIFISDTSLDRMESIFENLGSDNKIFTIENGTISDEE